MSQAFNLSQLANKVNTSGQLDVATGVTGTQAVANGGTGAATLTANNVLLGNGTSAVQVVAPGSNGNVLTSNGSTWTSVAPAGGGVTSLNGQTGAITNTNYNAIGSYIIASNSSLGLSTQQDANVTVAGSSLVRSNVNGNLASPINTSQYNSIYVDTGLNTNCGLSGTWRTMTRVWRGSNSNVQPVSLFVRIS